ncbi:hypothetical protein F4808DRAFT_25136 [Astrocystis sublimbata]|nr:hypothetical protein F4808DRAFT_25136 [Astrocystis sublimbata]
MSPLHGGGLPCTAARVFSQTYRHPAMKRLAIFRDQRHTIGHISTRRHASSKRPKPAPKPLPYQPAQPKQQRLKQQQQQKGQKWEKQKRDQKQPVAKLVRERWFALLGFGAALSCIGYFTASLAMYWRQDPAPHYPLGREPETPTGRPSIQSPYEFDLHLDKSEWRFGITSLRREISGLARGHVLEVAIGTGRNFEFYDWNDITWTLMTPEERKKAQKSYAKDKKGVATQPSDIAPISFTGVDISPGMLDIALQRMHQVVPHMAEQIPKKPSFAMMVAAANSSKSGLNLITFLSDRIRLLQSDVQTVLPAPPVLATGPSAQKYDTIIQTFGLCSVRDPVALVSLMASSLQPGTGRIILIEHGRSVWDLINGFLDRGARAHHERFGCWWNRDIEVIVNAAARQIPGLEIVRLERPGWATAGTHVVVELRVIDAVAEAEKPAQQQQQPQPKQSLLSKLSPFSDSAVLSMSPKPEDPKKKD